MVEPVNISQNQTLNQTVNQTLNQTAQAANTSSQGLLNDPIFLGVIGIALLIGLAAIVIALVNKKREDNPYTATSLKDRLKEKQVEPAMEFGRKPSKKLDYGMKELGNIERYYKSNEQVVDGILDDLHDKDPEEEDITDLDLNSENKDFKNITFVVGPTGLTSRLKMKIKSNDPIENPHTSVYSVPASSVNNGDRVVIDDEKVDWNHTGGIYYSKDVQGVTTMYNYSALSLIGDLTKVFSNKGEITQALNEKFVEWKNKKQVENQAFIDYMKEKEGVDADNATD